MPSQLYKLYSLTEDEIEPLNFHYSARMYFQYSLFH